MRTERHQLRYQKKALDARIKTNVGIALVQKLRKRLAHLEAVMPQVRCQDVPSGVSRRMVGRARLRLLVTTAH